MSYMPDSLRQIAQDIREVNAANGWGTPMDFSDNNEIPSKLALVHSEVSEALEGFRKGDEENFAEELADVVIRTLDLAYGLGVDMEHEIKKKVDANRARAFKHGGKRI